MSRVCASAEQFSAMLDYMERNGDLSRPQPGAQGRLKAEQQWAELTELLNSMGGGSVQRQPEKWKRAWSDWKTKTKKKASALNRDTHGTGGGPSLAKPLTQLEERILKIMGIGSITGQEELEEAGFEIAVPETNLLPSISQPVPASPPVPEGLDTEYRMERPATPVPEPQQHVQVSSAAGPSSVRQGVMRSPSSAPSTPRRRRLFGQRRRRYQTPFEQATLDFVRIEQARLRLEEQRMIKQHERDMEQLRVESQRISVEESRNQIFQRIADIGNNLMQILDRFLPEQ